MGKKINKTVFVGVSGGVDSSVSAALLKEAGYTVVGVFIRTWTPDFIECTWRDERRDAMRVCAHLGIPFLECDAEEAYKKGVADYMIEEYKKGNTPNPDVMCNREVKFGIFWEFAKKHGADFIATGHYAQVVGFDQNSPSYRSSTPFGHFEYKGVSKGLAKAPSIRFLTPPVASQKLFLLACSTDTNKDQSYFLWTLTQEDLSHTLFPVGHLEKKEVRKLAEKFQLPTATKKDSQGVCFLGPLDMKDFLKHYIPSKRGDVLDEQGEVIGYHDGAVFFTLGERHGFVITRKSSNDDPYYVIKKDIEKNTIVVSMTSPKDDTISLGSTIPLKKLNIISYAPLPDKKYEAQVRYHGELLPCTLRVHNRSAEVVFDVPVLVSAGQSIVIYDGDVCLGGGVVE